MSSTKATRTLNKDNTSMNTNHPTYKTLRLILGDQLNADHSWFKAKDDDVLYIIAEMRQEATYTKHHIQKICAFFSAMAQLAVALTKAGHQVLHLTLDETNQYKNIEGLLDDVIKQHQISNFEHQYPDEYRLHKQLENYTQALNARSITSMAYDSEHFLLPFTDIKQHFKQGKHQKMEFFYRRMRKQFSILMDNDQPLGGQWNYDKDNRKKLNKKDIEKIPAPLIFSRDVTDVLARLKAHNISTIGKSEDNLSSPTNRQEALALLKHFCEVCLPNFGTFQDAMTTESKFAWSLYHSRIGFALNSKILSPLQVINEAVDYYHKANAKDATTAMIDIAQVEGFVRQILGWREYIRGVYWVNMPDYKTYNNLDAQNNLPDYFWSGNTKMNCMKHAIDQSLDHAYAHHIQRLMITGNFCMLTEIHPDQVDEWYLGIYIDAIEWVELPNTRGMSQFADGGIVATKPYAAGGNYINKMSDYCKTCDYKIKEKTGDDACPFNSLYWRFMIKHRETLSKNPRIGMIYRNWDKQDDDKKSLILTTADNHIVNIQNL
jgi:deoxyribodipyrimidine photolyase-related protein